jgi:hypothetical protein
MACIISPDEIKKTFTGTTPKRLRSFMLHQPSKQISAMRKP